MNGRAADESARPAVIAAVPTPFDNGGEVDLTAARALFHHVSGVVGELFVAGTTGEFPALGEAERLALIETALETAGPGSVIAHIGAPDAYHAARLAAGAVSRGATRLAAITPHYLPARPDEVADYFRAIREAAPQAELYAYLFPERTGLRILPQQLAEIAAGAGLNGAKLSGEAARDLAGYAAALPGLPIYSGDDSAPAAAVRNGGAGVVSGLSAAFPEVYAALAEAVGAGDSEVAHGFQQVVTRVAEAVGPSIGRLKHALRLRGLGDGSARMAVDPPGEAARFAIARLVGEFAPAIDPDEFSRS